MIQGHKESCYYCKEACDSLAANPGRWPIPLCHRDDPGKVKWHHIGCVSERLIENGGHEEAKRLAREACALENFIKQHGLWDAWGIEREQRLKDLSD